MSYFENLKTFVRTYELGSMSAAARDLRAEDLEHPDLRGAEAAQAASRAAAMTEVRTALLDIRTLNVEYHCSLPDF